MGDEAARWKERRDNYVSLGIHPKIAGALAWEWLDAAGGPESLTAAAESALPRREAEALAARRQIARR